MKFHFMDAHREEFRIASLCRVLGVSRSGYYAWRSRPLPRRQERNLALLAHIRDVHEASMRNYGSPRVHHALLKRGVACGRHRVARLMRYEGIVSRTQKHFRWTSTKRSELPAAPDRLKRCFQASEPNRVWVSDITYLRTGQGWLFLAIVLDLYSRRVVGWAMHPKLGKELVLEALHMAVAERRPAPGLVFHTDRGGEYLSADVQVYLDRHGILSSMSRPGECLDNAVAESFFHTLKTELYYHHHFKTRQQASSAVFHYIAAFYNRARLHSTLGFRSPFEYETVHSAA
jgi:putative transposase